VSPLAPVLPFANFCGRLQVVEDELVKLKWSREDELCKPWSLQVSSWWHLTGGVPGWARGYRSLAQSTPSRGGERCLRCPCGVRRHPTLEDTACLSCLPYRNGLAAPSGDVAGAVRLRRGPPELLPAVRLLAGGHHVRRAVHRGTQMRAHGVPRGSPAQVRRVRRDLTQPTRTTRQAGAPDWGGALRENLEQVLVNLTARDA
jgi:hypothetical protein